jgi:PKD repeat protein
MTYKFLFPFCLFAIVFLAACDKNDPPLPPVEEPLVADFTTSRPTEPEYIFFPVIFVNKSSAADKYTWNFGDGMTSSDKNPTHTYTQIGTYTVSLTAEKGTESETKTFTLEVKKLTYSITIGVSQGIGGMVSDIIPSENGYHVLARRASLTGATLKFEAYMHSMDISGKIRKIADFPGIDLLNAGDTDDSGNLFLCGHKIVNNHSQGSIVKTSPDLNVLFEKNFSASGNEDALLRDVVATPDGGCVAAGYKNAKLWVIKTDSNGDVDWENEYANAPMNTFNVSIMRNSNNDYLIGYDINEDQKTGFAVMTISNNGFIKDLQKTLIGGETIRLGNLVTTPDNGWVVTADINGGGTQNFIVQKFAANGSAEWVQRIGSDQLTNGRINYTSDDGYVIAAKKATQLALIRLNASGNLVWERNTPKTEPCIQISNVFQMLDGGFLTGSSTEAVPMGILQITKTDKNGNVE